MARRSAKKSNSIRTILLHPVIWFVVATTLLVFTATALWKQHRNAVLADSEFVISNSNINVTQPPAWLQQNVDSVVDQIAKSKSSLLDPAIVPHTYEYLDDFPWIREIQRVEKLQSGLSINLQYRQPVAFVDLDRNTGVPVDNDGVIFDRELLNETEFQILRQDLMRISLRRLNTRGSSVPWQAWPDSRVAVAVNLCSYLAPVREDLELFRIVSFDLPAEQREPRLEVWTANGTVVIWGSAPGFELAGEAAAADKLAALQNYVSRQGKLSEFPQRRTVHIDVSTGAIVLVKSDRYAEAEDFSNTLLK